MSSKARIGFVTISDRASRCALPCCHKRRAGTAIQGMSGTNSRGPHAMSPLHAHQRDTIAVVIRQEFGVEIR